jgi:CheY-specific phosphatase CheX
MDVRLINPFVGATQMMFNIMLGQSIVPGRPTASRLLPAHPHAVNAIITMEGGATGVLILRFPSGIVLPVATALAGPGLSLEAAYDAIGEITTMVTGNAKRDLTRHLVATSVPTIAVGDEALGEIANRTPWLYVPFTGSAGTFYLAVSVSRVTDPLTSNDEPDSTGPRTPAHRTAEPRRDTAGCIAETGAIQ